MNCNQILTNFFNNGCIIFFSVKNSFSRRVQEEMIIREHRKRNRKIKKLIGALLTLTTAVIAFTTSFVFTTSDKSFFKHDNISYNGQAHASPGITGKEPEFTEEAEVPKSTEEKDRKIPAQDITKGTPEQIKAKLPEQIKDPEKQSPEEEVMPTENKQQHLADLQGQELTVVEKTEDKKIEDERIEYQKIFQDDLFIGDSITESLAFYEFIDDTNVLSHLGLTLAKAQKDLAKVEKQKPRNIYILFGANDLDGVLTDERFIENYKGLIEKIKEKSPSSAIYVQSILPVAEKIQKEKEFLNEARLTQLNAKLEEMAKEESMNYLDIRRALKGCDEKIYEKDGIHFKCRFNPLWLDYIRENLDSTN